MHHHKHLRFSRGLKARRKSRPFLRTKIGHRPGKNAAFWNFWRNRPAKQTAPAEPEEVSQDCTMHGDCAKDHCCNTKTRTCIKRSAKNAHEDCELFLGRTLEPYRNSKYPEEWEVLPNQGPQCIHEFPENGQPGFNAYAQKLIERANLKRSLSCKKDEGDRWYQQTVAFLVHPKTPIKHLLVAHQLGTGKTITMLRVLDNFFDDVKERRPRVLLFPTETVAENFYRELATKPNRYRTWLEQQPDIPQWPELEIDEQPTPHPGLFLKMPC